MVSLRAFGAQLRLDLSLARLGLSKNVTLFCCSERVQTDQGRGRGGARVSKSVTDTFLSPGVPTDLLHVKMKY